MKWSDSHVSCDANFVRAKGKCWQKLSMFWKVRTVNRSQEEPRLLESAVNDSLWRGRHGLHLILMLAMQRCLVCTSHLSHAFIGAMHISPFDAVIKYRISLSKYYEKMRTGRIMSNWGFYIFQSCGCFPVVMFKVCYGKSWPSGKNGSLSLWARCSLRCACCHSG